VSDDDARPAPEPTGGPPPEPSFGELLRANLRVVGWLLAVALAAFAVWRALAWLFPEVAWLRPGG